MAEIRTYLRMYDSMSPALRAVTTAANEANRQIDLMSFSSKSMASSVSSAGQSAAEAASKQQKFTQRMTESTSVTDKLTDKIKALAGAYLGLNAVKNLITSADKYTSAESAVNMINDGTESTAKYMNQIYDAAQRSRQSFVGMAQQVSALKNATGDLFTNNSELLNFDESLQKMFSVSHVSSDYAQMATVQLEQALSVGALRGQDYHSVASEAPILKKALASYMGVNENQLKSMADEGQLSAEIVKNAVLAYSDQISARLNQMPRTFSDVWTAFKSAADKAMMPAYQQLNQFANSKVFQNFVNNAVQCLPQLVSALTQVLNVLMQVFNFTVQNWSTIGPIVAGVATAFLAFKVAVDIAKLAQLGFNVAALPAIIIIAAVVSALMYAIQYFGGIQNSLNLAGIAAQLLGLNFQLLGMVIYNWGATAWGSVETFAENLQYCFQWLGTAMINNTVSALGNLAMLIQNFINDVIFGGVNAITGALNQIPGVNIPVLKTTFGDDMQGWANGVTNYNNELLAQTGRQNELNRYARDRDAFTRQEDIIVKTNERDSKYNELAATAAKYHTDAVNEGKKVPAANDIFKNAENTSSTVTVPPFDPSMLGGETKKDKEAKKQRDTTNKHLKKISQKTDKIADDNLKLLQEYIERTALSKVTPQNQNVIINMGGIQQNLNNQQDADGIVDYFVDQLRQVLGSSAEGVHR